MNKKKYTITIKETLSREIEVEANSASQAEELVRKAYKNENIVLNADDFNGLTEFIIQQ